MVKKKTIKYLAIGIIILVFFMAFLILVNATNSPQITNIKISYNNSDIILSWSVLNFNATKYEVLWGTTNPPQYITTLTNTSIEIPASPNTEYYLKIVAFNSTGYNITSPLITIYTTPSSGFIETNSLPGFFESAGGFAIILTIIFFLGIIGEYIYYHSHHKRRYR
ncbi:MAG: fibronectin type III domain-containing protein [Candidatus Nanopusillus acidilobi]